ncbi:DUF4834 family protein [Hymenobacter aquaticus]|uniref:DUF4834 family protein n=1 Tax=Hymenobacter aquaticus TaxID=1867101 RepID=A0A4Z0PVE2_9BACT|nr:DUF4834 family protein [Hymenobacter aquaticus]TGE20382.1 DUF4834 family protein [Hymenobacter aquaticus]
MIIKFLLIFLVLSFAVRFILPVLLRFFVGRFVQKQARRYGQQFGGGSPFEAAFGTPPPQPRNPAPGSGNVQVDFVPPKPQKGKNQEFRGGEYVDFEEVK